jgi:hypothetical protein
VVPKLVTSTCKEATTPATFHEPEAPHRSVGRLADLIEDAAILLLLFSGAVAVATVIVVAAVL